MSRTFAANIGTIRNTSGHADDTRATGGISAAAATITNSRRILTRQSSAHARAAAGRCDQGADRGLTEPVTQECTPILNGAGI